MSRGHGVPIACGLSVLLGSLVVLGPLHGESRHPETPSGTFFHAEGRHIVSDSTGEKVVFRGVNLNGLEFGSFFDHPYPGVLGTNYFAPRAEDFTAVKGVGFNVVRLPFEWARLVPGWQPGDPLPVDLDPEYRELLDAAVSHARFARVYVILDMHHFLKYWSGQGSQQCVDGSPAHQELLVRTWQLLADHYRDEPVVLGFDLVNEPVRREDTEPCGSCGWHGLAARLVAAVRERDPNHLLFVEGPNYSLASDWQIENPRPFVTDAVVPPRIVYSPHVFFDFDNDSLYDRPGEDAGPLDPWEYYVRDRLAPAIDWSIDHDVPIFFGETGVPCTACWATLLDQAFADLFEPLHLSVTAWHYIDPQRCPLETCPLNLLACAERWQLNALKPYPGGTYVSADGFAPVPVHSLLYDDERINPWDAGDGSFGEVRVDFAAPDPEPGAEPCCVASVEFPAADFSGFKLLHHFGVDTRRWATLRFRIWLTGSGQQDFKIFTTSPVGDCARPGDPEHPPFDQRPLLSAHLPLRAADRWLEVEVPLASIVGPDRPALVNGIAFQNLGAPQELFYVDDVMLTPAAETVSGAGFYTLAPCRVVDSRPLLEPGRPGCPLGAQTTRLFRLAGRCGLPRTARAVAANIAVTEPGAPGFLRVFRPAMRPGRVSSINYSAAQTRGNNGVFTLGPAGEVGVRCGQGSGTAHFILDISGYFQ